MKKKFFSLFLCAIIFSYFFGGTAYASSIIGAWNGSVDSNELGGSGNIENWIFSDDGNMTAHWSYTIPDGSAISWDTIGPYSFSAHELSVSSTGQAYATSPFYPGIVFISNYALMGVGSLISDTQMSGAYQIFFDSFPLSMYNNWGNWSVSKSLPTPEPATMLLLGTGLVGVAAARRKKKNQA